jgi:DNA-binding response OmpR family regulator
MQKLEAVPSQPPGERYREVVKQADTRDGSNASVQFDKPLRFRRFSVFPHARQLLLDGRPVEIGGRAFDLLIVLLEAQGALVTKNDILKRVWPSMVVEDCNLRFQVGALRKALGQDGDIIKTIVRRGYMLASGDPDCEVFPDAQRDDAAASDFASPTSEPYDFTVALIEDDVEIREAIDGFLRSAGWRIESFPSVKSFQESNRSYPPGCLILDVWLPGTSGLDFQADLARAGISFPIIFISGYADIPMTVKAMKAGAVEFLTKPLRHQELLDAIQLCSIEQRQRDTPRESAAPLCCELQ